MGFFFKNTEFNYEQTIYTVILPITTNWTTILASNHWTQKRPQCDVGNPDHGLALRQAQKYDELNQWLSE